MVTDFTQLNKYIKRPVHPFPSAADIVKQIPSGAKYFAKLDALQGYHQVLLHEQSRPLTTFLLPMGKFRYKRGPMGLRSTSDVFCEKTDPTIQDVDNAQKIVDDILLCAFDADEIISKLRTVLENCRQRKIALYRKKLVVGTEMDFAAL